MTALVTGAGSGIGQAAARALADAGARVVVTELPDRLDRAEATVAEIRGRGRRSHASPLDVRDLAEHHRLRRRRGRGRRRAAGRPGQQRRRQRPPARVRRDRRRLGSGARHQPQGALLHRPGRGARHARPGPAGRKHRQHRLDHGARRLLTTARPTAPPRPGSSTSRACSPSSGRRTNPGQRRLPRVRRDTADRAPSSRTKPSRPTSCTARPPAGWSRRRKSPRRSSSSRPGSADGHRSGAHGRRRMDGDLNGRRHDPGQRHVVVIGGGIVGTRRGASPRSRCAGDSRHAARSTKTAWAARSSQSGWTASSSRAARIRSLPPNRGASAFARNWASRARLHGVTPQRRRAFVLTRGRLHDLPEGLSGLVPTRLAPLARSTLLSRRARRRVALDYAIPPRRDAGDESLGGFIRRRLGREAWERLVEPLMAGIYAADGDALSLRATFPQLREAELDHGGLIRGVLAARRTAAAPPASAFLAPDTGLSALVAALRRTAPHRVRRRPHLHSSGHRHADGARLRDPAGATAKTWKRTRLSWQPRRSWPPISCRPARPSLRRTCGRSRTRRRRSSPWPSAGDEIPHPLDGHGYVVPRIEGGPILACTWSSRKWAGRAPEGWELIRVFVGRSGREDVLALADDELVVAGPSGGRGPARSPGVSFAPARHPLAARHAPIRPGAPGANRAHRASAALAPWALPGRERVSRRRASRLHRLGGARRGRRQSRSCAARSRTAAEGQIADASPAYRHNGRATNRCARRVVP